MSGRGRPYVGANGSGTGRRARFTHSPVMASAVESSNGRCRRLSSATDVSAACTVTFTAATVLPDASLTGAAIDRMPSDSR